MCLSHYFFTDVCTLSGRQTDERIRLKLLVKETVALSLCSSQDFVLERIVLVEEP